MQNRSRLTSIENKLTVIKGKGGGDCRGKLRIWDYEIQATMYKIDKIQGYIV